MALPGGGPLSFSDIRGEFGGTVPDSLSEYYEGGGLVPPEAAGNIPTSGTIAFSDFYDSASITPHPFDIGESVLGASFGSTSVGTLYDQTYTFDPLNDNGTYKMFWSMTAIASYGFTYGIARVYKNGVIVYDGHLGAGPTLSFWNDSWFRDYSGTRALESGEIVLGFGDEVRVTMIVGTRDSNAYPTNHTAFEAFLTRVS